MDDGGDNADECEGRWKQCPHHGRCYKLERCACEDNNGSSLSWGLPNEEEGKNIACIIEKSNE